MTERKFQFDAAMKELEAITAWFEQPDIDLDQGLVKFERGMELAAELKDHLAEVENRVEKIKVKFNTPTAPANQSPIDDAPADLFE
jgi:exodeoxyribonuclease VII small subunit